MGSFIPYNALLGVEKDDMGLKTHILRALYLHNQYDSLARPQSEVSGK